jgi:hypothetical protein
MRVLYKWNPGTKTYDPYTVPDEWRIPICCTEQEAVINCACCGKELKNWYSYESKEILFSPDGRKTLICMDCYYKELYQKRIVRKEVIEE